MMLPCECAGVVLVVEDVDEIREALAAVLQDDGCAVATARHGAEALEYLHKNPPPALILLDLMMPVMNGREFLRCLRADNRFIRIPVLVLSAVGGSGVEKLGVAGVLQKPIQADALLHAVRRHGNLNTRTELPGEPLPENSDRSRERPRDMAKILVVDDRPENLLAMQALLEGAGREVIVARSGEEALRELLDHYFAVILLDVQMPGMDGIETAALIRQREQSRHTPIIFVTANSRTAERARGYAVGAVDFLYKPLDPDILTAKVAAFVELAQRTQELQAEIFQRKRAELSLERALAQVEAQVVQAREAEVTARQQGEFLQTTLDAIPVMLAVFEGDRFTYVNRSWERVLGWTLAEAQQRNVLAEMYPDPVERRRVAEFVARADGEWATFRLRRKNGAAIDTLWCNVPLSSGAVIGIGQDITERLALEEKLRHSQKMEAVGRLAGGVAHDFNNMLGVITGYSELLLQMTSADDYASIRSGLLEINKASERAAGLTRQLLAFSRKQLLEPKTIHLGRLILDVEKMLRRLIGEDIELRVDVAPDLAFIKADPGQLEQVLLNLVINARDAMPQGGVLSIETYNVRLDHSLTQLHSRLEPGEYVRLVVRDTGCGMAPETLSQIFEPFFTTKPVGQGTGLGLSTVHGIVQQSDGYIEVESKPARGSIFRLYFPRFVEERRVPDADLHAPITGSEVVLLVEDEGMVRSLVQQMLRKYGYTVLSASDGAEALEISERHEGPIHLLLTDVVMPGQMNGRGVAEALLAARPALKVLYMSGYTDDAVVRHGVSRAETHFIQKPFTPPVLARKLRELLG